MKTNENISNNILPKLKENKLSSINMTKNTTAATSKVSFKIHLKNIKKTKLLNVSDFGSLINEKNARNMNNEIKDKSCVHSNSDAKSKSSFNNDDSRLLKLTNLSAEDILDSYKNPTLFNSILEANEQYIKDNYNKFLNSLNNKASTNPISINKYDNSFSVFTNSNSDLKENEKINSHKTKQECLLKLKFLNELAEFSPKDKLSATNIVNSMLKIEKLKKNINYLNISKKNQKHKKFVKDFGMEFNYENKANSDEKAYKEILLELSENIIKLNTLESNIYHVYTEEEFNKLKRSNVNIIINSLKKSITNDKNEKVKNRNFETAIQNESKTYMNKFNFFKSSKEKNVISFNKNVSNGNVDINIFNNKPKLKFNTNLIDKIEIQHNEIIREKVNKIRNINIKKHTFKDILPTDFEKLHFIKTLESKKFNEIKNSKIHNYIIKINDDNDNINHDHQTNKDVDKVNSTNSNANINSKANIISNSYSLPYSTSNLKENKEFDEKVEKREKDKFIRTKKLDFMKLISYCDSLENFGNLTKNNILFINST